VAHLLSRPHRTAGLFAPSRCRENLILLPCLAWDVQTYGKCEYRYPYRRSGKPPPFFFERRKGKPHFGMLAQAISHQSCRLRNLANSFPGGNVEAGSSPIAPPHQVRSRGSGGYRVCRAMPIRAGPLPPLLRIYVTPATNRSCCFPRPS